MKKLTLGMSSPVAPGKERVTVDLNAELVAKLKEIAAEGGFPFNRFLEFFLMSAVGFSDVWGDIDHACMELVEKYESDTPLSEEEQEAAIERFKEATERYGDIHTYGIRAYLQGVNPGAAITVRELHKLFRGMVVTGARNNFISHYVVSAIAKQERERLKNEREALADKEG